MKPAFNKTTRRQFLIGTGGLTLPLPLLPSLFPGDARAQVVAEGQKRFFVHATTYHSVLQGQFYGANHLQAALAAPAADKIANYAGYEVRRTALRSQARGNGTFISDCVQTTRAPIPSKILGLITLIDGLDMIAFAGHNEGGPLGGSDSEPTIDQVMASSRKLFAGGGIPAIVRHKVSRVRVGGGTQATAPTAESNVKLFDLLFGTSTGGAAQQPLIVDAVRQHLNAVRNDPQLSAECKALMDNHVELMFEAESNVRQAVGAAPIARPTTNTRAMEQEAAFQTTPSRQAEAELLWNEVVVAAFASGLSRIYVSGPKDEGTFSPLQRDRFHEDVAHQLTDGSRRNAIPEKTAIFNNAAALQFENTLVDLAKRMDAVRGVDGKTLLDKGLLAWTFEMGSAGAPGLHHGRGIPTAMIGNLDGWFNTGLFVDYRNMGSNLFSVGEIDQWTTGLAMNQWFAMVLRGMGLTAADYSANQGIAGYPTVQVVNGDHPAAVWARAREDLPFLKGPRTT